MPKSEIDALRIAGANARLAGQSYYENPMFTASVPLHTVGQWLEWHDLSCAWAAGWLREDAGRDQALQRVLNTRFP